MKRIVTFTVASVASLFATIDGADRSPAAAQTVNGPMVTWRIAAYGSPRATTRGVHALGDIVDKATQGKFKLNVVYNNLAPEKETIDGIKIGAFEAGLVTVSVTPGKLPVINVLNLPFLPLGNLDQQTALAQAFFETPWAKSDLQRWDAIALMPVPLTPYELTGKGKPPLQIPDLKGMRIRAAGSLGDAVKLIGASANSVAAPEIFSSMQTGVIDAAAMSLFAHKTFRTIEIADWYTANLALGIVAVLFPVGEKAMTALPAQYRKLVLDSAAPALDEHKKAVQPENDEAERLYAQRNVRRIVYTPEQRQPFVDMAGEPLWNAWVKDMTSKGIEGQQILDFVRAKAKELGVK
ncbi:MAG: TRAP transporter substrate-binding protein DctP [Alphaproteobacteria bacterium]